MLVFQSGTPTWRPHTGLCKFEQNISTNIWSLGKRTDLKLGQLSSLPVSYNITIFDFIYLMVFDLLLHCVTVQAKNREICYWQDAARNPANFCSSCPRTELPLASLMRVSGYSSLFTPSLSISMGYWPSVRSRWLNSAQVLWLGP